MGVKLTLVSRYDNLSKQDITAGFINHFALIKKCSLAKYHKNMLKYFFIFFKICSSMFDDMILTKRQTIFYENKNLLAGK